MWMHISINKAWSARILADYDRKVAILYVAIQRRFRWVSAGASAKDLMAIQSGT